MKKLYIALTAHNPLNRAETTLRVLKEYEDIPVEIEVDIFVDHEHASDLSELDRLLSEHSIKYRISLFVAGPEYTGYSLCWAHKENYKYCVRNNRADYYMYSENDMLFGANNFLYWLDNKDRLKKLNLEPGFCRFEQFGEYKIPFDNYRKWRVSGPTPNVWGDVPHNGEFITDFYDPWRIGWVTLGNPYAGLMILDQEDAEDYIVSESCDISRSYAKTGKRNWPVADRSSMGLAFEGLRPEQEHRRVVAVCKERGELVVPHYALVEHLDSKYSPALVEKGDIITTDTMLAF
jgi:hypothetical protein